MKVKKVDSNNRAPHTPQFNVHPFADPIMYLSDKTSTNLQIDKKKTVCQTKRQAQSQQTQHIDIHTAQYLRYYEKITQNIKKKTSRNN